MKIYLLLITSLIFLGSCSTSESQQEKSYKSNDSAEQLEKSITTEPRTVISDNPQNPIQVAPENTGTIEAAQNAEGVWHYTCPKGCTGGAGSALPCESCGTTLAHNTAYHATSTVDNTSLPAPSVQKNATPPRQEPAQNPAGIWHYTCPNGCAGGAGSAMPCAGCGTTLAHNAGYH